MSENVVADDFPGSKTYNKEIVDLLDSLYPHMSDDSRIIIWACEPAQKPEILHNLAELTGAEVWALDIWTGEAIGNEFIPWKKGGWHEYPSWRRHFFK